MDNEIQLNKYYKSKYFYHIDPDRIISRLPKDSASKQDITSLFHAIFHEIILESKAFSEYILPENDLPNLSFFNDSYKNDSIRSKPKTLIALCKASLFHHCILHGFETHLSDSSSLKNPYIKKKMYFNYISGNNIPLSGATDRDIGHGFFYSLNKQEDYTDNKDTEICKTYNSSYYKRFNKNVNGYSHHLLESYNSSTNPKRLWVPKYQSSALLFLFQSKKAVPFDNAILSSEPLYSNIVFRYETLYGDAKSWKEKQLSNKQDCILFDTVLENSYRFMFLEKMKDFLYKLSIPETVSNDTLTYHDLEGQAFLEMVSNYISSLPITYNCFIFLEYACYAALHSTNLKDIMYPPLPDASLGQRFSFATQSKDQLALTAIQRISDFFRMLNYCTIPLLEDLWDVIDYKLNLTLNDYIDFIDLNYEMITADYSAFYHSETDFHTMWKNSLAQKNCNFEDAYNRFSSCLKSSDYTQKSDSLSRQKSSVLNNLSFLIQQKCRPIFSKHTAIDEVILSQSSDYKNKTPYYSEYDVFQRQHLNSIFNFVQQYNPNCPY